MISHRAIKRGSFRDVTDLVNTIKALTDGNDDRAEPFIWAATAQSIIDKAWRLSARISGSAH